MNNFLLRKLLCILVLFTSLTAMSVSAIGQEKMDIEDYVRQVFIGGIPYSEAAQYTEENVPVLLRMLNDYQEVDYWANIVVMLQIIGNETVVDDVIDFIEENPGGTYSDSHYRAVTAAIYGMGYLVNRHHSKIAEKYLIGSLSPNVWSTRGVQSLAIKHTYLEDQGKEMSMYAAFALALSGSQSGAEALRSVKASSIEKPKFQGHTGDFLDALLAENAKIRRKGLEQYYKNERAHTH